MRCWMTCDASVNRCGLGSDRYEFAVGAGAVGLAMVFEMVTATAGTRKLRIALTAQIRRIDRRDALLDDL